MISGVTREIDGQAETFRLTTRAMLALEDRLDAGVVEIVQTMQVKPSVRVIAAFIAETVEDGAGADMSRAEAIIDAMGLAGATEIVGQTVEAAFPDAKEAPTGNKKRAGQPK